LEFESSILLFFTGQSRESAKIIEEQVRSVTKDGVGEHGAIDAMHQVKEMSYAMKECLLKGNIKKVSELLGASWEAKKQMAHSVSTGSIDAIAAEAMNAGASAVKISGAGGGGFMMIFTDPVNRNHVIDRLSSDGGKFHDFSFTHSGVETWKVN
jgi:D-glycero-alpha-D-manno-heptose-7-phosphate kinase